ncbi:SNF1-related protein kinase regulatory subunit beta-3-like [Salvia divinorum]|uniref:SNF1-related protein kinase regulatory subunit beta-3-like n=1 Tax=Salvia divinorum TaxID=28513 RepID=A0ABD1HSZ2_SALDI
MNNQCGEDQDQVSVAGFDVPNSPEASYNNVYSGSEDDGREPPMLPPTCSMPCKTIKGMCIATECHSKSFVH